MLEDKLSDEEIREFWAEHFPRRPQARGVLMESSR
jgi:hypothetical protein